MKDALDYETQHKNLSDDWYSLWRTYLKQKVFNSINYPIIWLNFQLLKKSQVAKSSIWRTFWTKLDKTLGDTEPTDYKEICMIIDHKAKVFDLIWRLTQSADWNNLGIGQKLEAGKFQIVENSTEGRLIHHFHGRRLHFGRSRSCWSRLQFPCFRPT